MTSFGDGAANNDLGPSRRDVVTYGTAAAIAAAVDAIRPGARGRGGRQCLGHRL